MGPVSPGNSGFNSSEHKRICPNLGQNQEFGGDGSRYRLFLPDVYAGFPKISLGADRVAFEAISPITSEVAQPRAIGQVRVAARLRDGRTVLDRFRQQGSAKALYPRTHGSDLQAVLLNTAGGVTGGDVFSYAAQADDGAWLTLATQTAERGYLAQPGLTGRIRTDLTLSSGARIDWLPQETILFDGAAIDRGLQVDMAPDATLLAVEPLILGRKAMGERLNDINFRDTWRVRRGTELIYADALRLHGPGEDLIARPAVLDGARALATVLLVAPDAGQHLNALRNILPDGGGASLIRPGVLATRLVAPDGFTLRRALIPVLEMLRGAPLPTVWKM